MEFTKTELYEIIESMGIDPIPSLNILVKDNMKTLFTSIDFISLIIALEDRYNTLFPKEILEAEIVNYKILESFINDSNG